MYSQLPGMSVWTVYVHYPSNYCYFIFFGPLTQYYLYRLVVGVRNIDKT